MTQESSTNAMQSKRRLKTSRGETAWTAAEYIVVGCGLVGAGTLLFLRDHDDLTTIVNAIISVTNLMISTRVFHTLRSSRRSRT